MFLYRPGFAYALVMSEEIFGCAMAIATCPRARLSGVGTPMRSAKSRSPGKGLAPVCSQEILRHAVDARAVAYLGGGGALGGQQRAIAGFGVAHCW